MRKGVGRLISWPEMQRKIKEEESMKPKIKLLKCKCSPKGCTHWEVILNDPLDAKLKCVTCGDEHHIGLALAGHDKLHVEEHHG